MVNLLLDNKEIVNLLLDNKEIVNLLLDFHLKLWFDVG